MEKVAFISNVCYRATMYQYVYPTMGLMTECQYDICKRDFSLDIVEGWAKENDGPYFCGANPSLADLYWVNLWLGNNWVMNDDFELPWKHKDVIDKYPASKKIIDGMLELPAVKTVCDQSLGEGDAGVSTVNATGLLRCFSYKSGITTPASQVHARRRMQTTDAICCAINQECSGCCRRRCQARGACSITKRAPASIRTWCPTRLTRTRSIRPWMLMPR